MRRSQIYLLLAFVLSSGTVYFHLRLFLPYAAQLRSSKGLGGGYSFGTDFYPIWLTAGEAQHHRSNPYTADITRKIQIGVFGRPLNPRNPFDPPADCRAFAYPAFTDLIFWPLSLLPFETVRIALAVALAGITTASIPLWLTALGYQVSRGQLLVLIMLTLSSYAALEGLFAAQPGLLVAFLVAASFDAIVKDRLFRAGSLFAFTLIKPQMSVLVLAYLLVWSFSEWQKRRNFVIGFLVWSSLLTATSMIVWPRWIAQWLGVLSSYRSYTPPPLISYAMGPKLGPILWTALFAVSLILIWRTRSAPATSSMFLLSTCLLLAITSITLLPGQAVYDHIILLPGILLVLRSWRSILSYGRSAGLVLVAGAIALFWQWIIATPLLVVHYSLRPGQPFNRTMLMLPFHTAGSIPMAVLAVLGYAMGSALRHGSSDQQSLRELTPAEFS
ncbi:MAG TPA: glycosyltransferase family 87 protein [Candidatus Sulfotelmatobacter sp.]|nr:glycosyltransferase family 87 protein [Candidatus Sulfotelmatobacter sp.]